MKRILLASACILALASSGAIAQTGQPSSGASSQGNVRPDSSGKKKTTTGSSNMKDQRGDSKDMKPSVGPSNTNNMRSQAGGGAGGAGGGK